MKTVAWIFSLVGFACAVVGGNLVASIGFLFIGSAVILLFVSPLILGMAGRRDGEEEMRAELRPPVPKGAFVEVLAKFWTLPPPSVAGTGSQGIIAVSIKRSGVRTEISMHDLNKSLITFDRLNPGDILVHTDKGFIPAPPSLDEKSPTTAESAA